ncbi:MAG: hypothetical protein M1828_004186 [Chrysothrix sp. TS-e1954]|nr:MAG: hypothetical protein M1828_004186 [Chrysothrix sp. TS-e1954]
MRRITPRTCLWPITISILCTFALSIGLTFRSNHHCYAGVCGEWLFPLQARLHVIIWYSWISISVTCLAVRAFSVDLRQTLRRRLLRRKIPFIEKHFSLSGLLVISWIVSLYGVVVGVWWIRLRDYFEDRGHANGVAKGSNRLAAIALTGHFCDITMGMVLLPISRHSALESFFKISVSTSLNFHMLTAYTLFILVLIHGFLYVSWVPVWTALSSGLRTVFPVLNPTYFHDQVWPGDTSSLGIWRASLVFTGLFVSVVMCLIFLTTLPQVRSKHFNLFYFTHLLVGVMLIVICLHASTMFYCCAPGFVLWIVDWAMRVFELRQPVDSAVTALGNGYYVLAMQMPRHRLSGCACTSPLAHFYIYHSDSSLRELHPFTTITHLASEKHSTPKEQDDVTIQFLFRKRYRPTQTIDMKASEEKSMVQALRTLVAPKKKKKMQWTEKLANKAHVESDSGIPTSQPSSSRAPSFANMPSPGHPYPMVDVALRLEGPYFTPAEPSRYQTVICFAAGTGISGAIAIARAFFEIERQRASSEYCGTDGDPCMTQQSSSVWRRCIVVWSVREGDYVELPFLKSPSTSSFELRTRLTGNGRPRLNFRDIIQDIMKESPADSTWAYISGPNPFIAEGEKACESLGVDHFGARWEI